MRRVCAFAILMWILCISIENCRASGPEISAKAAILMDCASGRVLYAHNADARLPIASTTKIMTCLLALENAKLTDMVTAGKNASGVPGTSIYLAEGETLSMEEMLYGMMLRSGNDAAVAIAESIAGSVPAFADMMNARAEQMGANAYFTTPNGLDEGGNGASARAIAEIAREALKLEAFRAIVRTQRKTIPWVDHAYARVLTNKNRLLSSYAGAIGVKTGFTSKAGRCLVFAAERDGMRLVGAVLNCANWFEDASRILDYGFDNYTMHTALRAGNAVKSVPVEGSGGRRVRVAAAQDLCAPLAEGENCGVFLEMDSLRAPVRAGDICGFACMTLNGEVAAKCALVALDSAAEVGAMDAFRRVWERWPLF